MGKKSNTSVWAKKFIAERTKEAESHGLSLVEFTASQSQGMKDMFIRWYRHDIGVLEKIKPKQKLSIRDDKTPGKAIQALLKKLDKEATKVGEEPLFYAAKQSEQLKFILLNVRKDELRRIEEIKPTGE